MANRLALVGSHQGSWIDVSRVKRPAVQVSGLRTGIVSADIRLSDDSLLLCQFKSDGLHCLVDGSMLPEPAKPITWIRLTAVEAPSSLICEIAEHKAA